MDLAIAVCVIVVGLPVRGQRVPRPTLVPVRVRATDQEIISRITKAPVRARKRVRKQVLTAAHIHALSTTPS